MSNEIATKKLSSDELVQQLEQFYGTENYFKSPLMKYVYTDGVQFFAEKAGAYWLLQEINYIYVYLAERKLAEFLSIKVTSKNKEATIAVDDGNDQILFTRKISFTDLPEGVWSFFLYNNTLLLPSEY